MGWETVFLEVLGEGKKGGAPLYLSPTLPDSSDAPPISGAANADGSNMC